MAYAIMTADAGMPASCWGKYKRIAVVEYTGNTLPKMISERARGMTRIVRRWEKLNFGSTKRCAYGRAMEQAKNLLAELRAEIGKE